MSLNRSVSVIVMAYNEEKNLGPTLDGILREVPKAMQDYEIIVIDDGSTDGTRKVADTYVKKYKSVTVYSHPMNLGFGYAFRNGLSHATKHFVIGFPGDNDTSAVSLKEIIEKAKDGTIINAYTINPTARSIIRNIISKIFVVSMNILFRLNLPYFNGSFVCNTKDLQSLNLASKGLAIYAEAKVRLLKRGYGYEEVPFVHIRRIYGHSKAVSLKSVLDTLETIRVLVKDLYFAPS